MTKKLVKFMIGAAMIFVLASHAGAETVETAASVAFKDVNATHWAIDQIELAVEKGYISGFPDGTFRPDDKVSRGQFIRMLVDALKLPHVEKGEPWYQPYVAAAIETGIHEHKDFKDNYDKALTRLEMSRLSVRAVDLDGDYEDEYWMVYATEKGIIHGVGNGVLQPEGLSTRAQAVAVIERVLAIRGGKKLPTDAKAIETAKIEAYHQNLFTFGFTNIVKLPVTVEDESGFKVTINSIMVYNRKDSKPIVEKYELYETRFPGNIPTQVWQYDLDGFKDDYTLFLLNITVRNDGKKEQAYDFYDLDRDYSLTSANVSPPITAPGDLSQFRRGTNRTDYAHTYRVKQGESFTTNQVVIFKKGELEESLYFNVLQGYTTIANLPSDKAR